MTPETAARFAATKDGIGDHTRNALQIIQGAIARCSGLEFSEMIAVRNRLEAIKDLAEEGRQLAAGRVALRIKTWAQTRL